MFSKGQIVFSVVFFLLFVIMIVLAYRTDKKNNKAMFKGSYKVLLFAVLVFLALYGLVKLKHWLAP
jgi:hypothetical protein